jgi:glycosyltransferase involved in cell wall biosynthesis
VKGYHILIAALTRLKAEGFVPPAPFEIHIAGEGMEREALEAAAHAAGIEEFRLVGYVDRPRDFLAGLHLYVQPSRSEGLCIAAHEAMQAGLGVVASAVGELAYTIAPGGSGALVPPDDPIELAETLAALLRHPERLGEMGRQARARVLDRFSAAQFAAQGQAILARLNAA